MAAACGQPLQQALEPLHSVPVLRQHPAVVGVGQSAEAVELQFKEPRRVVERLLAVDGDDGLHGPGNRAKRPAESSGKAGASGGELCGYRGIAHRLGGTSDLPSCPHAAFVTPAACGTNSRGLRFSSYAVLGCLTPMIGAVLPQCWQRSGRFPMKVSRLIL